MKYRDVIEEEFYLDQLGELRRKKDGYYGRFKKGDLAQTFVNKHGYVRIQMPKHRFVANVAHIVALLAGMNIPEDKEIDHIDGNRLNNHPSNLRIVNRRLNSCNRGKRKDNTSGTTGIHWSNYHQHYVIRRTVKGKRLSRSRKTLSEAKLVLAELQKMDSDYTERHGK